MYNYVLYLFVYSLAWNETKFQAIGVTIVSHVINKFNFQQVIHERKKSLCLYNISTRCIWTKKPDIHHKGGRVQLIERKLWPSITILPERFPAVWIKKYVAPVSLNYRSILRAQVYKTYNTITLFTYIT